MTHLSLAVWAANTAAQHPATQHVGFLKHLGERLQNFGVWGLAAASLFDSALIPIPWQPILIGLVSSNPSGVFLYPLVAALASAVGGLVPFYFGRLGGELFLLGKINRERYERLRDRFERQEFIAILVPAMGPPPTPFKLFEFSAGVFEMKPLTFLLAAFLGKLVQYGAFALITRMYGPSALHALGRGMHEHGHLILYLLGAVLLLVSVVVLRRIFARRGGTRLPIEEEAAPVIVEE